MTMSFKKKESTIQVTICCPPASFTSGRKDACRLVVPTLSVTKSVHTIIRITAFARERKSYWAGLLLTHENGGFGAISVSRRSCAAPVMREHRPYWIGFCRHSVDKACMKHLSYQQESPLLVIKVYPTLTF